MMFKLEATRCKACCFVVYVRSVCVCERGTIQASPPHSFAPNPPLHAGPGARVWKPEAWRPSDKKVVQRWWRSQSKGGHAGGA